jgi:hypothetical protein
MPLLRVRLTNTSIRNLLIWLFIAFLSGMLASGVPLYFMAQHEPKELFFTRELMTASYAPLWITLAAAQFGPLIITTASKQFRPLRKYALAMFGGPFLFALTPPLDPFYYSSFYTRCARLSEQEVDEIARAWIAKRATVLSACSLLSVAWATRVRMSSVQSWFSSWTGGH